MAVTQYIGARYVPVFADPIEWSSAKSYEALTIVMHQGNSYTSRQFVPAGIEIDDDDYWALTANFSAQIEQYRNEVGTYSERITEAQANAASAKETAETLDDYVAATLPSADFDAENTVKEYVDGKTSAIDAIIPASEFSAENTVKEYVDTNFSVITKKIMPTGLKALIYGDSTMVDHTLGSTPLGTLIAQETGMEITNNAVGGTSSSDFKTIMQGVNENTFAGYDYVFVAYATNDWQASRMLFDNTAGTTFYEIMEESFNLLDSKRGTCRPIIVAPSYSRRVFRTGDYTVNYNNAGANLEQYVDLLALLAFKHGYGFIDLYHDMGVNETNYKDYMYRSSYDEASDWYNIWVHYNQSFKELIAKKIANSYPFAGAKYPYDTVGANNVNTYYTQGLSDAKKNVRPYNFKQDLVWSGESYVTSGEGGTVRVLGYFTGRDTVTLYNSTYTNLVVTVSDDNGNMIKTQAVPSGYHSIYVDGLIGSGRVNITCEVESSRVAAYNVCIFSGHIGYSNYVAPSQITGMRTIPAAWTDLDSSKIYVGYFGPFIAITFNYVPLAPLTSDTICTIGGISSQRLNVQALAGQLVCYDSSGWHTRNVYLETRANGTNAYLKFFSKPASPHTNQYLTGTIILPTNNYFTNAAWT